MTDDPKTSAAWPYRVTVGFHTDEDRDEFLREHVDRPCSDIDAPLHLIGIEDVDDV